MLRYNIVFYILTTFTTFPKSTVTKKTRKSPFGLNLPFGSTPTTSNRSSNEPSPMQTLDMSNPIEMDSFSEVSEELTDQTMKISKDSLRTSQPEEVQEKFVTIRVISGAEILSFYVLQPGDQIMVGREEQCELHLNNIAVSKKHAIINYTKKKKLFIIDAGSTNGTFVNHQRISQPTVLSVEDYIEIGDILLQVKIVTKTELDHMQDVMNKLQNAQKDPLTDLFRRDFLETQLPKIVEQRMQLGEPISCVFIDLDKFKPINDTFGHQVGDKVLKTISNIIQSIIRKQDPCIRYGGDEMLIVYPKVTEARAKSSVERIRQQIAGTPWHRIAQGLSVSASFGVAEYRHSESLTQWIHRADMAAYAAKDSGRNCVRTYSSMSQDEKKRAHRRG